MRRALITGVNGFTGHFLTRELEQHGWEVWGLGSHPEPERARYRHVDLLDADALGEWVQQVQPQAVIHLAAIAFVGHSNARAFYDVNVVGTRNLLSAVGGLTQRPERVLLASSANIYGNTTEGALNESTPANPANDYAVSKLSMEYMARLWMDKLPITIMRPFNYTGVGQSESFLLPKIVSHFLRKAEVIELGNMEVWRDFSDVRDVAAAYRRLLDSDVAVDQVVNVCSGRLVSLREVLQMAESITGQSIKAVTNPAFVRANEVKTLCGDASRLSQLVGTWEPRPLDETLTWMLSSQSGAQ
ncbi:NAD-dependent epimerase/dehydratase family protein [Diaphorobacter sp. HDW4A]|uniref:GDP-mannose 4,6-dehydratase n=1 Tax=Diaphorobacter sp. HDW4A TaxID=2714924 RepID=UPI00140DC2F2|nr:GDP-mannose 4,6-dehydratase [Diaphorobacter sp. HDW4A]QIL81640.1 NAD-dependent epimerase/dehydratase family protein [Diaphorobacter sp. HDW4A]